MVTSGSKEKLSSSILILFSTEDLKTLYPVSISVKFKLVNKLHINVRILLAR